MPSRVTETEIELLEGLFDRRSIGRSEFTLAFEKLQADGIDTELLAGLCARYTALSKRRYDVEVVPGSFVVRRVSESSRRS